MAVFPPDCSRSHELHYRLAVSGILALFWRPEVLLEATSWLRNHGYRVVEFDTQVWRSVADMHTDLSLGLSFPDYYGANLNALNDCLGDVSEGERVVAVVRLS